MQRGLALQRGFARILCASLAACSLLAAGAVRGQAVDVFAEKSEPILREFCISCHEGAAAQANVDLSKLLADQGSFSTSFRTWQKVAHMLADGKMPPSDEQQPSDEQRDLLLTAVRGQVHRAIHERAGDPGPLVIRRLTGAEYRYTIADLTGLDLDLERDFVSDAVGGEGFANVGDVQFMQDSTLERYLEAAHRISQHAMVGSGKLFFFNHPSQTGLELSAIERISAIYKKYGFSRGSGEGGAAYGLEMYPKGFYVTWRYLHREALGTPSVTLEELAAAERLSPRFVRHLWNVFNQADPVYPNSAIIARWKNLPPPAASADSTSPQIAAGADETQIRRACNELYAVLQRWHGDFRPIRGDAEEVVVFTPSTMKDGLAVASLSQLRVSAAEGANSVKIFLTVTPVPPSTNPATTPLIQWRQPIVAFAAGGRGNRGRRGNRRGAPLAEGRPLKSLISEESAAELAFGRHPAGVEIPEGDFVTRGMGTFTFEVPLPEGVREATFQVEAALDSMHGDDCVVQCVVSDRGDDATNTGGRLYLAEPEQAAAARFRAGIRQFAQDFPEVSQLPPSPSDRDAIPALFNNTYNRPERNFFHVRVKYAREDQFLTEQMLDDDTRRQLDQAWHDLRTSFDYYETVLKFAADKHQLDLGGRTVETLDQAWIDAQPAAVRKWLQRLRDDFIADRQGLQTAENGHTEEVLRFAEKAWRRPLVEEEKARLTSYYKSLRSAMEFDHRGAIRAMLARILTSPGFLFRAEPPRAQQQVVALNDFELASRLSYLLWSSGPDAELWRAAQAGELSQPEQLANQARRMLHDPKSRRFATEFFGQWLGFYQFDEYRGVDRARFPEFTPKLQSAMYDEAISFFEHIVREDRPIDEILSANYAFLNRALREHYGVPVDDTATDEIVRVDNVGEQRRGGVLSLGAVLTATSAPLRTSPVRRGDWILRRLVGTPVPPPPADAGSIPADDVLEDGLTIGQRLAAHRQNPSCINCHARIDPLGFALENYDSIGRWREAYRDGKPIETKGTLVTGDAIDGVEQLKRHLAEKSNGFSRTLATKLLGYALGRSELASDQLLLDDTVARAEAKEGRFSEFVVTLVTSPQFRHRRGRDEGPLLQLSPAQTP